MPSSKKPKLFPLSRAGRTMRGMGLSRSFPMPLVALQPMCHCRLFCQYDLNHYTTQEISGQAHGRATAPPSTLKKERERSLCCHRWSPPTAQLHSTVHFTAQMCHNLPTCSRTALVPLPFEPYVPVEGMRFKALAFKTKQTTPLRYL